MCSRRGVRTARRGKVPNKTQRKAHESFLAQEVKDVGREFDPRSHEFQNSTLKRSLLLEPIKPLSKNILKSPWLEYQILEIRKVSCALSMTHVQDNTSKVFC